MIAALTYFLCMVVIQATTVTSSHFLLSPIEWKETIINHDYSILSYKNLNKHDVDNMNESISNTIFWFFKKYNKKCTLGFLEIRVVGAQHINNPEYFYWADASKIVYGRYFKNSNILYITFDRIDDYSILEHEIVHYLYDECNMSEENDRAEHANLDEFIRWKNKQTL